MENKYRILTFLPKGHFYNLGLKIEQRNQYKPFFQSSKSHSRRKVLSFWNSKIKAVSELPKNFWKMTKHSTFLRLSVPPSINCFSAFLLVLSNLFRGSMIQCSTAAGKKIPFKFCGDLVKQPLYPKTLFGLSTLRSGNVIFTCKMHSYTQQSLL